MVSVVEIEISEDDSSVGLRVSEVDELALDSSSSALTASRTAPSGENLVGDGLK
jgi:hypothetical protein